MTKQCELTGIKISHGNNVSHAHNKTKRTFIPNLQRKNIYSDILNQMVRLKISTKDVLLINAFRQLSSLHKLKKFFAKLVNPVLVGYHVLIFQHFLRNSKLPYIKRSPISI